MEITIPLKSLVTFVLRLLAVTANLTSAFLMATSHENAKSTVLLLTFKAKYSYTPTFKYFVIVNVVVAVYNIIIVCVPSKCRFWKFVVAADVVATVLQSTSTAAAVAIAQVNKSGNYQSGWRPICGRVHSYCDHVMYALGAGFAGLTLNLAVAFSSIYLVQERDDDDDDDC